MSCGCQQRPVLPAVWKGNCGCGCSSVPAFNCNGIPLPQPGKYTTVVIVQNSWVIPACGITAQLSVPNVANLQVGTYLYNPTYGRFLITAFNAHSGLVDVYNECLPGTLPTGTPVLAQTQFLQVDPQFNAYADWTPTFTASGALTVTVGARTQQHYAALYDLITIDLQTEITLGGSADLNIYATLPTLNPELGGSLSAFLEIGSTLYPLVATVSSGPLLRLRRADNTNFPNSGTGVITVTGSYREQISNL